MELAPAPRIFRAHAHEFKRADGDVTDGISAAPPGAYAGRILGQNLKNAL